MVKLRVLTALSVISVVTPSVFAQPKPISLCIVHTKLQTEPPYEPTAGPYAIGLYEQLAGRRLRDGARLDITVLAATAQQDILPEVRRLQCYYVVQLWHNPRVGDILFFSLWNGATRKVIAQGASPIRLLLPQDPPPPGPQPVEHDPCADLAQQIVRKLNKLP